MVIHEPFSLTRFWRTSCLERVCGLCGGPLRALDTFGWVSFELLCFDCLQLLVRVQIAAAKMGIL